MSKLAIKILVTAFVFLLVGLLSGSHGVLDGLAKAMFGVLMVLFFIVQFFGQQRA